MHLADLVVGEGLADFLKPCLQIFQVHPLGLLDQGIDDVDLTSEFQFTMHQLVDTWTVGIEHVDGANRLASRGEFVNDAHIEVAIKGHCQGTWNGGGSHHQHMRRHIVLHPEFGSLCHTKPMLFVNDHKS